MSPWLQNLSHENRVSQSLSRVRLFATLTVAHQAPPSVGFPKQGYGSGLPFPSPGDLPDPGMEPGSPALQQDSLASEPPGKPGYSIICLEDNQISWGFYLESMHLDEY